MTCSGQGCLLLPDFLPGLQERTQSVNHFLNTSHVLAQVAVKETIVEVVVEILN